MCGSCCRQRRSYWSRRSSVCSSCCRQRRSYWSLRSSVCGSCCRQRRSYWSLRSSVGSSCCRQRRSSWSRRSSVGSSNRSSQVGINIVGGSFIYDGGSGFGKAVVFCRLICFSVGNRVGLFVFHLGQSKFFLPSVVKNSVQRIAAPLNYAF